MIVFDVTDDGQDENALKPPEVVMVITHGRQPSVQGDAKEKKRGVSFPVRTHNDNFFLEKAFRMRSWNRGRDIRVVQSIPWHLFGCHRGRYRYEYIDIK